MVKIDSKKVISRRESKSVSHSVALHFENSRNRIVVEVKRRYVLFYLLADSYFSDFRESGYKLDTKPIGKLFRIPTQACLKIQANLRRVYTSRLHIRFPHCVVVFKYLRWFIYVYGKKQYYFKNATQCGKRMRKPMRKRDVATWL